MTDTPKTAKPVLRVITPEVILSYPHLFEAVAGPDGGEPKFSAVFVAPKGTDLTALKTAAMTAGANQFGGIEKFKEGVRTGKFYWPFRDDVEDKGYPEGSVFFSARSKQPPGIVSRFQGPDTKPLPITKEMQKPGDPGEVYAGCHVRASVVAFAFEFQGMKRGVSFALNNVQKLGEGDRLDNRRAAADEFEADLSEEPASLGDLL